MQYSDFELSLGLLEKALESASAAVLITDANAHIQYANKQFYNLTGYCEQEVIGKNPNFLRSGKTTVKTYHDMWSKLLSGQDWYGELINRKKNGTLFVEQAHISPFEYQGQHFYIAVKRDVTSEKNLTEKLSELAYFDALTRLPNRTSFFDHLQDFLVEHQDSTEPYSLLLIDLNEFKSINDSKGHDYGDLFLQNVARCFRDVIAEQGVVARLGGDEFVVLLPNCDANLAENMAQNLLDAIAYIEIGNKSERGSAAVGITTNNSKRIPTSLLLKQADLAMYRAKQCQTMWVSYNEEMGTQWGRKKALAQRLAEAIELHKLEVSFMPVIDLHKNEVVAYKSRLEWVDQVLGNVDRFEFIPIAEESQLIRKLNLFTIEQACKYATVGVLKTVAVKVSSKNFGHGLFVQEVMEILHRSKLPPQCLELEVFEDMLSKKRCVDELYQLVEFGCQITVADFGMGHISISELRALPIQKLKVGAQLTEEIAQDISVEQVAKAIVGFANVLNIETIAEGVTTEEQLQSLKAIGCHFASGPYISYRRQQGS
ncbi:Cyclic di-GMP phosphodiesterase Gmr [Vibrio thalassae]|uniref:Cyclic di-GMP phosphodiesterase Gmr n=1 Tax=Vibrio thalassae TaxID=1243014 RepID=A0A240EKB1_9VIBR|nr:EAL domain-containing protein [Vibrio thalassae]SNX48425.1 Cyclic di-GMP phosphodiesterase Gmr [Vibrio thalassae]